MAPCESSGTRSAGNRRGTPGIVLGFIALAILSLLYGSSQDSGIGRSSVQERMLDEAALDHRLRRGVRYLLRMQNADGCWQDFRLTVGQSDAWVTGMAAWCLSHAGIQAQDADAAHAYSRARLWLRSQLRDGGWGYNRTADTDADSTAWALRSRVLDKGDSAQGLDLRPFQRADGGVATFTDGRWDRWAAAHVDVTANLLLGLRESPRNSGHIRSVAARDYLLTSQAANGSWEAYWWKSPFYSTALAAELLLPEPLYRDRVRRALQFLLHNQNPDGGWGIHASNSIDSALCVRTLILAGDSGIVEAQSAIVNGLGYLCQSQREDGSWPPSAILAVPWSDGRPDTPPATADFRSIMSTSLAVRALAAALDEQNRNASGF